MKKILLFTSILVLTVTNSLFAQSPTLDTAFISQPIVCNGGYATDEMQVTVNQTAIPTVYGCVVGYYVTLPSGPFFVSFLSTDQTTATTLNFTGLFPNVDYCIRLVDSSAYYTANTNGSGTSSVGIFDEFSSVNFSEPDLLTASTSAISSNLCAQDCIADEELLISGGTGPYSFTFDGNALQNLGSGDSTYSFFDLCAGTYDIVVTDTNGCSTSPSISSFTLDSIDPIVVSGTVSDYNSYSVSCNGGSDGTITASAIGGTGTFTYSSDGINYQSSNIFSALTIGTYTIVYKDSNGCIETEIFTLNEPPILSGIASVIQSVDCYNANNGVIDFQIDSLNTGVPGYVFSINNFITDQASSTFINLFGDSTYIVKVMDINGCMDSSLVYLAEPEQITYSTIISNYNGYEVSCNDSSDGSIIFTSTGGGLFPYTYSIDGGGIFSSDTSYSNLASGIYNIEVKDASGCIDSNIVNLDDPGLFSVQYLVSSVIDCPGDCSGAISINALNGVGQELYSLDLGSQQTTPYFSGICGDITNGSYTLNAVDDNGCIASTVVSLVEPSDFIYTTNSVLEYCGQSDGQASIIVTSGGTGSLSYIWNNDSLQISSVANNLVAGSYIVEVTDSNNCQFTQSVTVLEDVGFTVSFTTISPCLGDSSGSAIVTAAGTPPFSYQWEDINGIIIGETSATISSMPIGTYSALVTDATSCVITGTIDIVSESNPIVIDSILVTNSTCYGINDAQIEVFASGGQQPYSYSNTNGLNAQPNPVFGMLAPDTYVVQAIDPNGCFDDTSITLSYPGLLEIDSTVFTQISCFGLNDGAIQNIQFVGGTGPFEFSVDGGPTQNYMFFSGLESGQHTVEVFDVNNCATSDYITIIEPTLLEVETTVSNWNNYQIRCSGDSLGYLNIICSGGTAPYLTDSSIFFNTFTIDSIWAGNYALVVEDANGCSYQETILFNEPSPIQHNFISTHINCATLNNGSVTDSVYGGVGSATTYSYLWDSGETNYSLTNLATGTYTITVTDENGCEDTESVTINDDNVFEATQGANFSVGCFDDCDGELSVNVSGGVPFSGLTSYNYLWNDFLGQTTESAIGLCVDSITLSTYYFCVVSDAVGCSDTVNFTLTQPEELQVDISISKPISCNGLSDGILKANVTGGELAYNYTWSNGGTNPTINSLPLGIYKVIVEDANTCRDTFEVYLSEPTILEISIQEFDISCFGDDDGYIEVLGSGGTSFEATYSYTLYSGAAVVDQVIDHESGSVSQTPFVFSNLPPGNYYVDAKDRNGCSVTSLSVEITEPFEPLTLLVDTVDETCLLNDGIIRIFPEGGSQSFNYFINGTPTLNNSNIIGGNQSGWYAITVVDTRGCEINDSTFIKDFRKIFLPDTLMNIDTTICLGQSIIVNVDERPELTYAWNDGIETGDRIIMPEVVLSYGQNATVTYTLTVTDANNSNCYHENIVVVNFNSIDPMLESDPEAEYGDYPIVLTGENINLFSDNNSCVEYTWQWGNDTITNANGSITINKILETDWYYLNVKDANGCLGYDSIYVVVGVKPYEAITPNGDNFNDAWTPLDIESYEQALVQVFNRWGGLVFESKGGNNYQEWDGTNNGKELAVGTYYYIIDLNTGDAPQTGPITIIR